MSEVPTRLAAFAVVLVVAFGGAYAAGSVFGPLEEPGTTERPVGAPTHDRDHGG